MSLESRKQKRELRKLNRGPRKEAFKKFIEAVSAFKDLDLNQQLTYQEKFKKVWPALKPTLEFVVLLKFTKEKFDAPAKEIISLGDNIYNSGLNETNKTEFQQKLSIIWDKIEFVLEILKILTEDKTDAVIDKIIEIGEWLFEN